jgi:hypothetical protein
MGRISVRPMAFGQRTNFNIKKKSGCVCTGIVYNVSLGTQRGILKE